MNTSTKNKELGSFNKLHMHLTNPFTCNYEFDSLQQLTVIVGQNGSGKSYILATVFAMAQVACSIIIAGGNKCSESFAIESAQFVFDKSFHDQCNTGKIRTEYTSGFWLEFEFIMGKVVYSSFYCPDDVTTPTMVVFMSSEFRTFNTIKSYFLLRKGLVAANPTYKPEEIIRDMTDNFRLFDVLYSEKLYHNCPLIIKKEISDMLHKSYGFDENITDFNFDPVKCDFYYLIDKDEEKKTYATTLSKGHQSILNIVIGNLM